MTSHSFSLFGLSGLTKRQMLVMAASKISEIKAFFADYRSENVLNL